MMWRSGPIAVAVLAAAPAAAAERQEVSFRVDGAEILGGGPDVTSGGLGAFDAVQTDDLSGAAWIEYRFGQKLFFVGPAIGVLGNEDGGTFGYGAVYSDIKFDRLVLTPVLGLGGYDDNDSKNLGGVFQFYVALGINYHMPHGRRVGLNVSHISNAGIHDKNPGTEILLLSYTVPLGVNLLTF